jgi:hypothetical protein
MRNFEALVYSLVFDPPLSAEEIAYVQKSTDPWSELAHLVHRASTGDFAGIGKVETLMRSYDSALFWGAATTFAGIAGPWTTVDRMAASFMAERDHYGVQYYLSNMLMYACNPAYTEMLLNLYEAGKRDDIRGHVARNLSLLLERDHGLIYFGAVESDKYPDDADDDGVTDYASLSHEELFAKVYDFDGYRQTVLEARDAVYSEGTPPKSAIFEGAPLDARKLADVLTDRAGAELKMADRIVEGVRLLSAMVGVNCRDIVSEAGNLSQLGTAAVLEDIFDTPVLSQMVPGRRYFFGHPVPN